MTILRLIIYSRRYKIQHIRIQIKVPIFTEVNT